MSENGIAVVRLNDKEYECSIELADAFANLLEGVKTDWRKMVMDFTKDCETTPMAVMGEMTPDVGRIFLEQAKHEWIKRAKDYGYEEGVEDGRNQALDEMKG